MDTFLNAYDLQKLKPKDINYLFLSKLNIELLGKEEKAKEWEEEQGRNTQH